MAKTESPSLWQSSSKKQVFLASLMTGQIGMGASLTVSADVPDLHYFCGRGGKDIIPLYRDSEGTHPNVTRGVLAAIGRAQSAPVPSPEDLAAYVYAILSAPAYQTRFAVPLQTPGPRVPITADTGLWREAVELGSWLLWLHTYAERFHGDGRGNRLPIVPGLGWNKLVRKMPDTPRHISYHPPTQELRVGDGVVSGVRSAVWEFSVSGMPVVKKWLGYRTAKGAGRAATSQNPLDRIRPETWVDEWNDELLDLLRILTLTIEKDEEQADILDRICEGPRIAAADLPKPKESERKPPTGG